MRCELNQAMFRPGETVICGMEAVPTGAVKLQIRLHHLQEISVCFVQSVQATCYTFELTLPNQDFYGYLLQVEALDSQNQRIAISETAVDCSSAWTRYPRYGYLWDFTEGVDAENKLAQLNRYHLNCLQFYDWQYRHHIPVAPDPIGWTDWSGRVIDGNALRACIAQAHKRGITCMAYNMVYAANQTYRNDGSGVDAAWRLVKPDGRDFTCDMDASRGDVGVLQYFNILNPAWQRYLFAREREVFSAYAFDGWHGDTIGENGPMRDATGGPLGYDQNGNPIWLVKDGYTAFLNAAKRAIGNRYLLFNPVGAQGIENVNVSDVDALYAEFWPWDTDRDSLAYTTYFSIHKTILRAREQSGGKSLIVAAYVNYRNPAETFNEPAVRLLDAVVFASGGARIELGNGDGMLSDEYFPADRHKRMSNALQGHVERLYDFLVAYENLLRDGQTPVERKVTIEGCTVSHQGSADTVWCFAMADAAGEIFHLINLTGTDEDWRDVSQQKSTPRALSKRKVKLYTAMDTQHLYIASPDREDLTARELSFSLGEDADGRYLAFTMPELSYWNLIFLR